MKKTIILLCIIIISVILSTGCSTDSSSPPLPKEEASEMMQEISVAVQTETTNAMIEAISEPVKAQTRVPEYYEINYTNTEGTVVITGSLTYDIENPYLHNYTMNVALVNHVPVGGDVSLLNGSMTIILIAESEDNLYLSYTGDFTVVYKGEEYECSWEYEVTMNGSNVEYSGSYTVNDYTYTM
ncbi:MAG: hypothetical protein JXB88_10390 [Spirochaetales bacterium]|nr:hypothetical protein [Spirochaetales bacterium]